MAWIQLPGGAATLIDDDDWPLVCQYKWRLNQHGRYPYVITQAGKNNKRVYMHRLLIGASVDEVCDHINGDTLDNRRANLRRCSTPENVRNSRPQIGKSSQYKGVYKCKKTGRWHARILIDGRRIHLGRFNNEVLAAEAYDMAAKKYFGQFARLNLPAQACSPDVPR